jgi:hypothetical protein
MGDVNSPERGEKVTAVGSRVDDIVRLRPCASAGRGTVIASSESDFCDGEASRGTWARNAQWETNHTRPKTGPTGKRK